MLEKKKTEKNVYYIVIILIRIHWNTEDIFILSLFFFVIKNIHFLKPLSQKNSDDVFTSCQ